MDGNLLISRRNNRKGSANRFLAVLVCGAVLWPAVAGAAEVRVEKNGTGWQLLVDGSPFYIKGAGCGRAYGIKGEDYLRMARDMGANCVRTWGTENGDQEYLDKAREYGLMVDAGIWLNWIDPGKKFSYKGDTQFKRDKWNEAVGYVRRFKGHPAVLMWNVGNETMSFSNDEEEKIAFCAFLETLIKEIHAIDPGHPVIYSSAGYTEFSYLKKYVPSLDIVGANCYCGIGIIHSMWERTGFDKPYVITEFGPYLPMSGMQDVNGRSMELGDYQKASLYKRYAAQLVGLKGCNLGGFVFHLGDTSQESMTWWNVNHEYFKKQAYWVMYERYTGLPAPFAAPRLGRLILSKQKGLRPGETFEAEVQVMGTDREYVYDCLLSTTIEGVQQHYVNEYVDAGVTGSGPKVTVRAPDTEGIYRVYFFVKDNAGNMSAVSKTIEVGPEGKN